MEAMRMVTLHDGTEILVTETATASVVRKWVSAMLHFRRPYYRQGRLIVGLGVQWTPYNGANPPADTLQLCIGHRCLIFHLSHANTVPRALRKFLSDPEISFVGFWNHSDRLKLKQSWADLKMNSDPYDLRIYAAEAYDLPELRNASVPLIVSRCLGINVQQNRDVSMSDWDREYLSDDQLVYASSDAYCAFAIGKNLRIWNRK